MRGVLIETLWNVKIYQHPQIGRGEYRINRNIVECKDNFLIVSVVKGHVLIETLWNVKDLQYQPLLRCKIRINRNIVECKAIYG